ncbi:MAG TPA: nucleotidyltransferase domain-containing protein [Rhizomicrobium sp.]|nr:nucleotidyltransferase domain-containing protein [Rhizomicrobium sp.]
MKHNHLMSGPEYLVAEALMPFPEVERIVLFGSRARGDAAPRSDIDLAIACPRADPKVWSDIIEAADEAPTLLQIDLVRMETAPPELLAEIAREGRVLYERNSGRPQAQST